MFHICGIFIRGNIGIKAKMAYIEFRNGITVYYIVWFLALVAGLNLLIAGIYLSNQILKLWTTVLAVVIFMYMAYVAWHTAKEKYSNFKIQQNAY